MSIQQSSTLHLDGWSCLAQAGAGGSALTLEATRHTNNISHNHPLYRDDEAATELDFL